MIEAEKIFYSGNILTQDKNNPVISAFAVAGGKIIAIGSDSEILRLKTFGTRLESLNGRTVLPGFNDAHIHIWKVGNLMTYMLDLRGVQSIAEMQERIADFANRHPESEWIQARGFNEALFPDGQMPNRYHLDEVVSDRPLSVIRTCAHQMIVNTKALERSGITDKTPIPHGGEIKLLPNGELAGHFTETALGLINNKIPPNTAGEYRKMILAAQEEMLRLGITSATDPAVMPDLLDVYRQMDREGELKMRINAIVIRVPDGASNALPLPGKYASDHLTINSVKFFADGGLSGKTAALKHPYKNSDETGVLRLDKKFFLELAGEAYDDGFTIATHAIGDAAIDLVLEVYEELRENRTASGSNKPLLRIEHLGFPSEANFIKMKSLGVNAVMQPIFIKELGANFRNYLTDDYLEYVYPFRSVLQHKINLSFSTDAPVVKDFDPWQGIQTAIERKDAHGHVIGAGETISLNEAVHAYTLGSAIANGEEENVGSIAAGKHADFIVLNDDPATLPSGELASCRVIATFIAGECVSNNM